MSQRRTSLTKSLNDRSPLNEDFFPVAYYSQITYWLSEFSAPPWLLIVVSALLVIFAAGMMNTIAFGVFASGFAASSLEIVVLLAFQVIYGYVYYLLGVIITVFMAGLACGALFLDLFKKKAGMGSFVTMQLLIAASALLLPSFFSLVKGHSEHLLLVPAAFVVVMFSLGFFIGAVFGVGSGLARDSISRIASHLYSIDLVGSALGALLVSSYFVPILGITKVCFIVAGMSLVSSLLSFVQRGSVDGWSLSFDRKGG